MEWDCISFSFLVKNSFQIFGPLTEFECFVLVKDYFLYLKLVSQNWVGYLCLGFSNDILNIFGA